MKLFRNCLYALAAITLVGLASCVKEEAPKPGEPDVEGCYGVYFPSQENTTKAIVQTPSDDTFLEISVARKNPNGAITVPVTASLSDKDVLVLDPIEFADGQQETTFKINFPTAQDAVTYKISLTIDDPLYASKYNSGATSCDIEFMRVAYVDFLNPETNKPAKVTFYQGWWGEVHSGYIKYYEVGNLRYCETYDEETVAEFDPSGSFSYNGGFFGMGEDTHLHFIWDKETNKIEVPVTWVYYSSSNGGDVYLYDGYHTELDLIQSKPGSFADWAKKNPDSVSYYDGNGGFEFYVGYYYIPGIGGWKIYGIDIEGIAEGFVRVDYTLKLYSTYTDNGKSPVIIEMGPDVAVVKYACYEGKLSATQIANKVNEIEEGIGDIITYDKPDGETELSLELTFEESGTYTLVACAYSKDEAGKTELQNSAGISFNYATKEDKSFDIKLTVDVEDTPARFEADTLYKYNSFFTLMYGSNFTDAKIGVYTMAEVKKYGQDAVVEDLLSGDSVSEEVLSKMTTAMGFSTVVSDLNAETEYVLVVWAANDYKETLIIKSYTTGPLPYEWNSLGTGKFTEGIASPLWKDLPAPVVDCEVFEEKTIPGLYKIMGFERASIIEAFKNDEEDPVTEENVDELEGVFFKNAGLIIDATDPESVVINPQTYCVAYDTDGFGVVSSYNGSTLMGKGTLTDGVITFPAECFVIVFGTQGYYGNSTGLTKLVLPGASSTDPAPDPAPVARKSGKKELTASPIKTVALGQVGTLVPCNEEYSPKNVSFSVSTGKKVRGKDAPLQKIR